jgi:signal transduction histidine kinase
LAEGIVFGAAAFGPKGECALLISAKNFNRLLVAAVVLGFVAVSIAALTAAWSVRRTQDHARWVNHTYEVQQAISLFRVSLERTEVARRGYLLSGDERFRATYTENIARTPAQLENIERLVRDNPAQAARLADIRDRFKNHLVVTERSVGFIRRGQRSEALRDFHEDRSAQTVREIRAISDAMIAHEDALLARRNAEQAQSVRTLYGILAITAVLLAFVGAGSIVVILRFVRDLTKSREELAGLNEGLEDAVQERTADLQRANDEIQRFAYIVSHDLRSPLVNVMGFTSELDASLADLGRCVDEIETQAAGPAVDTARLVIREDLPEAIGFIRTSTQKMDRLINAILRLSREGRRILAPERLNMAAVLTGVADNLRQRAEHAGAEVIVEDDLPDIVSDRTAIDQVFSNLVENAIKYAKPGRPGRVVIRGKAALGRVIYEVEDNGRGIDPKDHERIFELFRRSGVQDVSGEGIGLAHVRALVYRLGGWIACESDLDRGAIFRVSLPATLTLETAA